LAETVLAVKAHDRRLDVMQDIDLNANPDLLTAPDPNPSEPLRSTMNQAATSRSSRYSRT
jgi:hypothetical protein